MKRSNHSYIIADGQMVTLADTTKQFNIADNLGSKRAVVSVKGGVVAVRI